MGEAMRSAIGITWSRNRAYAEALVNDLEPGQMVGQPVAGVTMNHPAWILSHLNAYAPLASAMLLGKPVEDPIDHPFGRKSAPVNDAGAYPGRDELVGEYLRLHDAAHAALESADAEVFSGPAPLERWRAMHPTVGDMLTTLMVKHESMHLGQLSAWRRAMGLAPVAM